MLSNQKSQLRPSFLFPLKPFLLTTTALLTSVFSYAAHVEVSKDNGDGILDAAYQAFVVDTNGATQPPVARPPPNLWHTFSSFGDEA